MRPDPTDNDPILPLDAQEMADEALYQKMKDYRRSPEQIERDKALLAHLLQKNTKPSSPAKPC